MLPRFVVGAPKGRSGKTTISIAIGRALSNRALAVQPFKKGPDYIDPSWLTLACGRSCSNLDTFIMPEETLLPSFGRMALDADLTLIEGAMGLFDSPEADGLGSVAWLARLLKAPVILVVNAERMTRSIAALVSGYQHFEPETHIAAVILNNVSGSRHRDKLVNAVESHCGIPVVGAVPGNPELTITERHLGLTPSAEKEQAESVVATICEIVEKYLDLDAILTIAKGAPELSIPVRDLAPKPACIARVGVLRDRVFSFYYPENLEALAEAGVEVVPLDVLAARKLPDLDGLYMGGGFPELYASRLEANSRLRADIAAAIEKGLPTYAECAGLMYLCRAIRWQGRRYEMVGVIPAEVELSTRPAGHGYVELAVTAENCWFPRGRMLRGHEFHHSRIIPAEPIATACEVKRGYGIDGRVDGILYKHLFAAYMHLHALGNPEWARAFAALAAEYGASKGKAKDRDDINSQAG
ncbi:MAG: cobyrinate a,c-diamide synthase [Syntrophorhabdales bacterium]|jgi:cobyrinic acid a,c-diamide synthase